MFKYFKNIKNNNLVWKILNDKYLNGNIGNTVLKISEDPYKGNCLFVKTDNIDVSSLMKEKESEILSDINKSLGITLSKIEIV